MERGLDGSGGSLLMLPTYLTIGENIECGRRVVCVGRRWYQPPYMPCGFRPAKGFYSRGHEKVCDAGSAGVVEGGGVLQRYGADNSAVL